MNITMFFSMRCSINLDHSLDILLAILTVFLAYLLAVCGTQEVAKCSSRGPLGLTAVCSSRDPAADSMRKVALPVAQLD